MMRLLYAFGAAGAAGAAAGAGAPGPPGMPAGFAATSVAAFIECPLNWRVKLNSPSLCPTMFSVMYTGINFFPLCTAMVCPTNSGVMVERRDQVRRTFFSLREFMASMRAVRNPSTNGPFLVERGIKAAVSSYLLIFLNLSRCSAETPVRASPLLRPVDDELIRPLVIPRLVAARRLAPGRHRMPSTRSLSFAAAMGMIHRVHRDPAIVRTLAHPARASRLSD